VHQMNVCFEKMGKTLASVGASLDDMHDTDQPVSEKH
jgi:hypothetical protein